MSRVAAAYAVSYTQYRFVLRHFAIIQERFFLVNLFTLFFTGAIMLKHCRYSSSVEHDLPKVERWVRFPLPALKGLSLSDSLFYLSGEDPRFCKRWVNQYPACLSGGSQSPTEINAPRGRRTSGGHSLCADRSEAETAGIRSGIMSAGADPNPAPSLARET